MATSNISPCFQQTGKIPEDELTVTLLASLSHAVFLGIVYPLAFWLFSMVSDFMFLWGFCVCVCVCLCN